MTNRLTLEDFKKAVETLKRNRAAESSGKQVCDICGKKIFGHWLLVNLPNKVGAFIHADPIDHPCLVKAADIIYEDQRKQDEYIDGIGESMVEALKRKEQAE